MPRTDSSYFNFILRNNSARFDDKISVLDEDDYDAFSYESFNSDDISYNSAAGTVSFSKGGAYEITFSEILTNLGDNQNTSPKFYVNDTLKYTSQIFRAASQDPQCQVHRAILEIPDNGTLKIMLDVSGGQDSYLHAGSIVVANRLTGEYGRVHLSASTRLFTNINPFTGSHLVATDAQGRATIQSNGKLLSGVGYDDTHGRLISSGTSFHRSTAPGGSGIYAVAFNGIFGTGSVKAMTITASQNGVDFYNTTGHNANTADPGCVHNFHVLRTMKPDDYISLYAQCYSATHVLGAGTNAMTEGTTFAIYEIPNFAYYSATIQSSGTTGVVNNGDSLGIAADTPKNVWDLDDSEVWTGIRSASVTVHAESPYVNYNPTNGRFTAKRSGVYYVSAITKIRNSATAAAVLTKRLYVNGAVHISGTEEVISANILNYNLGVGDIITLLTLSANDYIEVTHESTRAFKYGNGSCMTMYQVGSDWKYKDNSYTEGQDLPVDLIDNDFVLNTYSTGSNNVQHNRDIFQSPFITSTPGPLSLRGKVEVDKMSTTLNEADAERYLFTKK